jgi:hypothetical protein
MAYQLGMDKTLSIKQLHASGMSERGIALALEVSRNAVRRHLAEIGPNDTKAPTGSRAFLQHVCQMDLQFSGGYSVWLLATQLFPIW